MERTNSTFVSTSNWLKALALLLVFGFAGAQQANAQLFVSDAGGLPPVSPMTKVLPEGQCGYQFQWTVGVFDPAGPATATAYITTSTVSTSVNPGATLMQLGFGQTYVLDVIAAVGTNTLTIVKNGPSGSITQTYTIIIDDVRAPQIYGPGNMTVEVPSCDTDGVPVNWTVSTVDDCDLAPNLVHTGGPASGSLLSPAGSPYTVSYSSTDDDGNTATYSFTVTVNQSPDPDPIIDVSGNGQFTVPACQPSASVYFTGNVLDCAISAGDDLTGQITVSGAPLTVVYIQEEDGFAFFEAVGNLAPGIYPIQVSYGGVTVSTLFNVEQDANQLPDIIMPGNLTFLLPACINQIVGRFAITVTDDCDPTISMNRLSFTYNNGSGPQTLTPLPGFDVAQGYFEFERVLTAADDGAVITARYTDANNNVRQVDATLSVTSQPDTWAPIIIYPSQDINVELDPCVSDPAVVFFEVTATDNCDGDLDWVGPGNPIAPGAYDVTIFVLNGGGGTFGAFPIDVGGRRWIATLDPGEYQVVIEAQDAAGNLREEDFRINITQDPPPPTNLACNVDINFTLDDNCQRFVTADMVLEGDFGCAQESDFRVNIVNDDDPTNGNILDGCGQFIYEVTYVGPDLNGPNQGGGGGGGGGAVIDGFTGAFAAANWTTGIPGTGTTAGDVTFTATTLSLVSGADDGIFVSIAMPANGQLQFDFDYQQEADIIDDILLIDLNGNIILNLGDGPDDEIITGNGSVNESVQAGWILIFSITGDDFQTGGFDSFIDVSNFRFEAAGGGGGGGGTFPFFNWEDCWGYVTGEDKAAPDVDCPANTSQGTVIESCFTQTGTLEDGDLEMEPLNFSCFIDGGGTTSSIDAGVHYYDLIPFQVDRTDYYTILVSDDFGSTVDESAIALFQGSFNPSNPCENIVAFTDEPIDDIIPPLANDEPYLRISLPLVAGQTYYLWVTSDDDISGPASTGDYTVDICPDANGRVGLFASSTVLNPLTWEPMTVNTTVLWPRRDVTLTLDLYCEDFDLIFNNPASLPITGAPVATDNCTADADISITFVDTYSTAGDCAPIIITRNFTITDSKGNATTCTQTITLNRPNDLDVAFPPRTVPIECDEQFATLPNGNPDPSHTGYPFIVTVSGIFNLADDYCNIGASFVDRARVNVCDGAYKFVRDWTVIDWCDGDNIATDAQVIKVGDYTPPSVTCPGQDYDWDGDLDPLVFSVSPFGCTASFSVPLPDVTDNCSDWEVYTEIVTEVEVDVVNQYGQVTGTRIDTVVVRVIPWNAPTRLVSGIPAGSHYFRYRVEDGCGNKVIVYCPFTVADLVEPTAICDDNLNVSIGGADFARIFAEDVDEGSNDNCGVVELAVRRTGVVLDQFGRVIPFICGSQVSPWGPFVDFYCCDVGRTITIELRVRDTDGNENICWLDIVPEEKVKPFCYAPHPVMVNCDELPYSFDATDTLQLQQMFGDATSEDNCGSFERELPPVPDLECGAGTIIRRFKAFDINGNESVNQCSQVVTIKEVHNFEIKFPADAEAVCGVADPDSVIYEEIGCDLLAVNHTDEFFSASGDECYKIFRKWKVINWCQYDGESDPIVIGRDEDCDGNPGDECVWVLHRPGGKTYIDRDDDETEPNNVPLAFQNICNGIDDFWRKIDYDGGFFEYTQIIKVYDDIDPEVSSVDTFFCSYDNVTCTGLVNLPFSIDENCTPDDLTIKVFLLAFLDDNGDPAATIDLQNLTDGQFDDFTLTGAYPDYSLNGRFPIGNHAFEVHVEDGCGNANSEELPFEVRDCKAPSPVCINGLAVELMPVDLNGDDIPDEGRMAIWANDFIVSAVPDCSGPVTYSINRVDDPANVDSTGIVLTCADTGTLVVEIWAYDGEGNADFCETYILVQDNMSLCGPDSLTVGISGAINTEDNLGVEDVEVSLSGQSNQMVMTGADGRYAFAGLQAGYDYTVTPELNSNYLNGVSTFDLVLMSKHILGVQPLGSPYKMIAADVNNSRSITTLDLIQLRKLILSIDTEFENNTSWRFVDASYVFPNASNPWFEEFPEVANINNLPGSMLGVDFVGVKIGDVNNDARANALAGVEGRSFAGTFALNAEEAELKAGGEYTVAFTAADIASIEGYQATLTFDNSALELVDIVGGIAGEENFGLAYVNEGLITTSWNQVPNSEFRLPNSEMFSLVFRAKADAQLSELLGASSRITKAEAYKTNGSYQDVALTFSGKASAAASFELYQNTPNPFKGETLIGFNLPADDTVTLTISDVTGKALKLVRLDGVKGYNNVVVNSNTLPPIAIGAGVLYYTVETSEYTATKKMVIIE